MIDQVKDLRDVIIKELERQSQDETINTDFFFTKSEDGDGIEQISIDGTPDLTKLAEAIVAHFPVIKV